MTCSASKMGKTFEYMCLFHYATQWSTTSTTALIQAFSQHFVRQLFSTTGHTWGKTSSAGPWPASTARRWRLRNTTQQPLSCCHRHAENSMTFTWTSCAPKRTKRNRFQPLDSSRTDAKPARKHSRWHIHQRQDTTSWRASYYHDRQRHKLWVINVKVPAAKALLSTHTLDCVSSTTQGDGGMLAQTAEGCSASSRRRLLLDRPPASDNAESARRTVRWWPTKSCRNRVLQQLDTTSRSHHTFLWKDRSQCVRVLSSHEGAHALCAPHSDQ